MSSGGTRKRCFVISPIGPRGSKIRGHSDDVLRFIIEPAMEELGFEKPLRADHDKDSGRIVEKMFSDILEADLCIAILTGQNPNVFYELAVAQCAARPVILLIQEGQELPFDVKDFRTIRYAMEPISHLVDGHYRDELVEHLKRFASQGWIVPSLFDLFGHTKLSTEQQIRRLIEGSRPETLDPGMDKIYPLPGDDERRIALVTGDLLQLDDIRPDVVVSLENTDLQLGSYYEKWLSGRLRYQDAERDGDGRLIDRLQQALAKEVEELRLPLQPGTVVATPTHRLAERGVKRVFHLAALQGTEGAGYRMPGDLIDECVRNVFNKFVELADSEGLESIALPMLGAYATDLDHLEVARRILKPVLQKMKGVPACKTTYVVALIESHRYGLQKAAGELDLEPLEEPGKLAEAEESEEPEEPKEPKEA